MSGDIIPTVIIALLAGLAGGFFSKWAWPVSATTQEDGYSAVRASSFALVDEHGRERTVLKLVDGSRPILLMTDEHQLPSGDRVLMPRLALGMLDHGVPAWELSDPDGKKRVLVTVEAGGTAMVELYARNNKAAARLTLPSNGPAALTLFDEKGDPVGR